jgi:hypothetical protein
MTQAFRHTAGGGAKPLLLSVRCVIIWHTNPLAQSLTVTSILRTMGDEIEVSHIG